MILHYSDPMNCSGKSCTKCFRPHYKLNVEFNYYQKVIDFLTTVLTTVFVIFLITHEKHEKDKNYFKGL